MSVDDALDYIQGRIEQLDNSVGDLVRAVKDLKPPTNPVVAVLPGQGWMVRYRNDNDSTWTEPVVGFLFYADGSIEAVDSDSGGYIDACRSSSNFDGLIAPGMRERSFSTEDIPKSIPKSPFPEPPGICREPGCTCPDVHD